MEISVKSVRWFRGRWKVGKPQNLLTVTSTVLLRPFMGPRLETGFLAALGLVFPTGRKLSQFLGTMALGLPALQ